MVNILTKKLESQDIYDKLTQTLCEWAAAGKTKKT